MTRHLTQYLTPVGMIFANFGWGLVCPSLSSLIHLGRGPTQQLIPGSGDATTHHPGVDWTEGFGALALLRCFSPLPIDTLQTGESM